MSGISERKKRKMTTAWENNKEIQIFREYLQIPSVHPDVNYEPCLEFLHRQATSLQLPMTKYFPGGPTKPIAVITWEGTEPLLPSIILMSHMDVVPVFEENWTHPPFDAVIDAEGRIFARGSQDMKSVGVQYLAAIRALKKDGITMKRTIHVMFVPDEEIGGILGVKAFVNTSEFRALNVGFSLDEGIASPTDDFPVFYAERAIWRVDFKVSGNAGHGSLLHKNTAGEKVDHLITKFMEFRRHEVFRLESNPTLTIGDVTTVNLTVLRGGKQSNVVPPSLTVTFDIRLANDVSHDVFLAMINRWCQEAGGEIELSFEQKDPKIKPTKIDGSNVFWTAFKSAVVDELDLKINTRVFPGGTDSRYIRQVGIPALGFSPINNTPILLHDHDEFLHAQTYLRGIEIYKKIIPKIANA